MTAARKLVGQLHLWLGMATGLVVSVLGLTGCLYCFEPELRDWLQADRQFVPAATGPVRPLDELWAVAQQAVGPQYPLSGAELYPGTNRTYRFYAEKYDDNAWYYGAIVPYAYTVYVDPYRGRVQRVVNTKWDFFGVVLTMHCDLLLGTAGNQIIRWSTVGFVGLLLSGLVLWWPNNWRKANRDKSFTIKWGASFKRVNYDLHNVSGFYALLWLLLISLTGVTFVFPAFRQAVGWAAGGGHPLPVEQPVASDTLRAGPQTSLTAVYQRVRALAPHERRYYLSRPEAIDHTGTVRVVARADTRQNFQRSEFLFDQYTGALLRQQPYHAATPAEKLLLMNYDLHVGTILGVPGQVLAFLASLVAATLPTTGFLIWWGRRRKKRKTAAAPAPTARLTAG